MKEGSILTAIGEGTSLTAKGQIQPSLTDAIQHGPGGRIDILPAIGQECAADAQRPVKPILTDALQLAMYFKPDHIRASHTVACSSSIYTYFKNKKYRGRRKGNFATTLKTK